MKLFWILLTAHVLADFVMQSDGMIKEKKKHRVIVFMYHSLIHSGVALSMLTLVNSTWFSRILVAIVVGFTHFLVDFLIQKINRSKRVLLVFFVDQLIHLSILIVLIAFFQTEITDFSSLFLTLIGYLHSILGPWNHPGLHSFSMLKLIPIVLITIFAGNVVVKKILEDCSVLKESIEEPGEVATGRLIGLFERLIIFLLVITNNIAATTWILTAKSIVRFDKIRDSKDGKNYAEYYLIGTLSSSAFAILMGLLGRLLLNL